MKTLPGISGRGAVTMKILFLQLPLLDHAGGYLYGNVEYGPAAVAGYLRRHFGGACAVSLTPQAVSCFGSDRLLERYVLAEKPDLVGFTCYLWNIERTLCIAGRLKEAGIETVVLGGPEIEQSSWALGEKRTADLFVSGEGEWFFREYFSAAGIGRHIRQVNGNRFVRQPDDALIPAHSIAEPLTGRMIGPGLDGTAYLELVRGCPHRCSYCFYSKRARRVRELPFDTLLEAMRLYPDAKELYILSPAFEKSRAFRERLRALEDNNPGIALHTEMRAGGIDDAAASLMYRAGFRGLEVGLQTLTPGALKIAGRTGNPEEELLGMEALKKAGISLKIGIIPGLPGDTPEEFIAAVDELIRRGFAEEIELYPLMVLPGTAVREYCDTQGYLYQEKPPYYFRSGGGFFFSDLAGIMDYVESETGYSGRVPSLPDFTAGEGGLFSKGVRFNGGRPDSWDCGRYAAAIETGIFSFHIELPGPEDAYRGLPRLLSGLPDEGLFNIILYCDEILDEAGIRRILERHDADCFYRRLHFFDSWDRGLRFRVHQVFTDGRRAARALELYSMVGPILRVDGTGGAPGPRDPGGPDILVAAGAYRKIGATLRKKYGGAIESVAFESEADQEAFFRDTGTDYVRLPYSFRIENR